MNINQSIHFDSSDFDKKMKLILKVAIPGLIGKGIGRAMLDMMNDCVMEVPTVPLKEGWLRGSASIFVQNKLLATGEGLPKAKSGKANTSHSESINIENYVGLIGFAVPYAAKMHEGIDFQFSEPSSGPKYLESKMISKRSHYLLVVANTIKEGGE